MRQWPVGNGNTQQIGTGLSSANSCGILWCHIIVTKTCSFTHFSYKETKVAVVLVATMAEVAIPAISFSQNNLDRYQTRQHIRCKKYFFYVHILMVDYYYWKIITTV